MAGAAWRRLGGGSEGTGGAVHRVRAGLRPDVPIVVIIAVVAAAARLLPVLRGGGLTGVLAYDDGVYFGAADALLSGWMPYRDFVFLHPPGITIVLAPFAALARLTSDPTGLAAARAAFMAVGALNAVLAYAVARRLGVVAGIVAGALYAVWSPATYSERTTLHEPLLNLALLLALLLLRDGTDLRARRVLLAGGVIGLAVAVKVWAVIPLVVLAVWVLRRGGLRPALRFGGAAAAAAGAVCLPFLALAPTAMPRMMIMDQLGRPNNGVSPLERLASVTDVHRGTSGGGAWTPAVAVAVAVAVGLCALGVAVTEPRSRHWVALLVAQTAFLLSTPSYFTHYSTFAAPALVLVMGAAGQETARVVRCAARWALPVAGLAGAVVLCAVAIMGQLRPEGHRGPAGVAEPVLASSTCVTADSAAALAVADVLTRDLRRGCPVIIDFTGLTYDQDRGDLPSGRTSHARSHDAEWQAIVQRYLTGGDAIILVQASADGFNTETKALLKPLPVLARGDGFVIYGTRPTN
jgi:alpha-1,2-mannosyltransferase